MSAPSSQARRRTALTHGGLPATPSRGSGNTINGCSSGGYCVGGDLAGNQTGYASIVARLVRGNAFMRLSYDLTDHISIYGSAIYSEVVTWDKPTQSFFKNDNLEAGCDNPYLPASVTATCFAYNGLPGTATFTDPNFRAIELICDLAARAGDRATLVDLGTIARRVGRGGDGQGPRCD